MTISVPVAQTLVYTNVINIVDEFNNTVKQNYPTGSKYVEGDSIYQNTGGDIIVTTYDAQATYSVDDVVFKDSLISKCVATTGEFPLQPEAYTTVDTTFDYMAWSNRYMKLTDLPVGARANETTLDISQYDQITDMTFDSTGTRLYICDNGVTPTIYQYSLTIAWDLSSAIYTNKSKATQSTYPIGLAISANGTKIYEVDASSSSKIYEYNLSTAYDVSTATYSQSFILADGGTNVTAGALYFKPDGTKFYVPDRNLDRLVEYTLTTAWNVATSSKGSSVSAVNQYTGGIAFSADGTRMYEANDWTTNIHQYNLTTAWSIATATRQTTNYCNITDGYLDGIFMSPDGTNVYCVDRLYDIARQWVSYTPNEMKYFQPTMYPINLYEEVEFKAYKYSIIKSGTVYTFQRTDIWNANAVSDFTPMNVYSSLDNSSIEEPSYTNGSEKGQWLAKTLIVRDDAVYIRTNVNSAVEYETLTDYQFSTITNPSSLPNFARIGASNKYRPFDNKNYTTATATTEMTYTVSSERKFDTIALGSVIADSATITFTLPPTSSNYALWLDGASVSSGGNGIVTVITRSIDTSRDTNGNLEKYKTTEIFYSSIPMESGSTVSATLTIATGEIVELGTILLGMSANAGYTNLALSHTYKDFSIAEYDAWGNLDYVERQRINTFSGTVDVEIENYDRTVKLMTSLGKNLTIVNGSTSKTDAPDSKNIFASTQLIGRFMTFGSKTKIKDNELEATAEYSFTFEELA